MLFFPFACVVLAMSQDVADVNLVSIIMHGSNQSNFVATDIKHGEFSDLVGVTTRNQRSEFKNQRRIADFGMRARRVNFMRNGEAGDSVEGQTLKR
jgi:hypothetical protein